MTWSWPERPRRVVVTGMGAVTALGQDVASTWDGLVAGRSGVAPITQFDASRVSVKIAAEVKDFDPSGVLDRKEMRRTDRYIQFALVTARQALDHAGLPGRLDEAMAARTGVIVGSGLGGVATLFDNVLLMGERGPDRISPFFIPMGIANVAAGQIAIATGALGPNFATVSACATGGHALGEAWETIRRGDADMMIAGGVEASIHEATRRRLRLDEGALDPERRSGAGLAAVRPGPGRLRHRRGWRGAHPRGPGARRGPRRDAAGGAGRLRRHRGCVAHHAAGARRHRARSGRPGARSRRRASTRPRSTT